MGLFETRQALHCNPMPAVPLVPPLENAGCSPSLRRGCGGAGVPVLFPPGRLLFQVPEQPRRATHHLQGNRSHQVLTHPSLPKCLIANRSCDHISDVRLIPFCPKSRTARGVCTSALGVRHMAAWRVARLGLRRCTSRPMQAGCVLRPVSV